MSWKNGTTNDNGIEGDVMSDKATLYKLRSPRVRTPKWFDEIRDNVSRDAGVDHVRAYKHVVVLQPYHAHGEKLADLISRCKEQGLKVHLTGKTNYYPSATFTICIYKSEHEQEMLDYVAGVDTSIEVPVGVN
jgi:hypothetical protein